MSEGRRPEITSIEIPRSCGEPIAVELVPGDLLFVVGPNGCGKSVLLQHIANQNKESYLIRRLSAHRQTWFEINPDTMSPRARADFEGNRLQHERDWRYRVGDDLGSLSIAAALFDLMAAEREIVREIAEYAKRGDGEKAVRAAAQLECPTDAINALLELGLFDVYVGKPHASAIEARKDEGPVQNAFPLSLMSDGERNAVMLAATVLTAVEGTTFLIDEPERHLHPASAKLFLTGLFAKRPDCSFVIATHELALPLSARYAPVVVVRSCTSPIADTRWDAEYIEGGNQLPEDLIEVVMGGRDTLLFVEGQRSSLDVQLYEALFPGVTVRPCGSWTNVRRSVEGIRQAQDLHRLRAFGLIDRDTRSETEVSGLQAKGVFALPVYSVEALYYCTAAIDAVAQRQGEAIGIDPSTMAESAKQAALALVRAKDVPERMAARRCEGTVRRRFIERAPDWRSIMDGSAAVSVTVDADAAYQGELACYRRMLDEGNLDGLVARYPIRETGARDRISEALKCQRRHDYERMVLTLVSANSDFRQELLTRVEPLTSVLTGAV